MKPFTTVSSLLFLAGCASASIMPIAQNLVQISIDVAPACGGRGAQNVAVRQAAVETIRRGFDRYIMVGADFQNNIRVVGRTPIQANTTGSATVFGNTLYGNSTTTYSGGVPIMGGGLNQTIIIKMFSEGDPEAINALSARDILGPDWQNESEKTTLTCLNR